MYDISPQEAKLATHKMCVRESELIYECLLVLRRGPDHAYWNSDEADGAVDTVIHAVNRLTRYIEESVS